MDVSIEERWQGLVDRLVKEGRYDSPDDVVRAGLRLVEEHEARRVALRVMLDEAIARSGEVTDEMLDAAIAEKGAELRALGIGE